MSFAFKKGLFSTLSSQISLIEHSSIKELLSSPSFVHDCKNVESSNQQSANIRIQDLDSVFTWLSNR